VPSGASDKVCSSRREIARFDPAWGWIEILAVVPKSEKLTSPALE
jgi:hypothetical protein